MGAAIRHSEVSKVFGRTTVLDKVSFDVPANSIFGLLGPNGAGKTTLFSCIAGFLKMDGGKIEVLDIDVTEISKLRGRMSVLPQDAAFQGNVPVVEQLIFFSQLSGNNRQDAEKEAENALEIVGLSEKAKKSARTLSHGMLKRMGIAQAFLGNPEVILLDEPTAGLDPANAKGIKDLVVRLQAEKNATIVISSHNLSEIQSLCSHVAILDKGNLVNCSAVGDLTQADSLVRIQCSRALSDDEMAMVRAASGVTEVVADEGNKILISYEGDQETITAGIVQQLAGKGIIPQSVEVGADLESRFLELTGR